jgi:hypothetical protein
MYLFRCSKNHETFVPSLEGADVNSSGYYITCGYFEIDGDKSKDEDISNKPLGAFLHLLNRVRAKIKTESNFMNPMDADNLEDWSCEEPSFLVS